MSDPLHISGPRLLISSPERPWERAGGEVNEGPVGFVHGGRTFISYSASHCSTISYAVGLLTNASGNLLDPAAWVKTGPHFKYHSGVKGSASFVPIQTVNGTETWTVVSRTEARLTSFGGTPWTQLFRAANPNYESYTVAVGARWVTTGTTSKFPKYGIYASYDDRNNFVAVFIDIKNRVLATYAVVQGIAAGWQNSPLPAGFSAASYHRLAVRKTGATYWFLLDGVQLQQRTFTGTFPVLLNGQVGLVSEDTKANYRNLAITDTN
jgi:hypothetical protein